MLVVTEGVLSCKAKVCDVVLVKSIGVATVPILFFFFQAEDGIRDLIVTGVQTCALPILMV